VTCALSHSKIPKRPPFCVLAGFSDLMLAFSKQVWYYEEATIEEHNGISGKRNIMDHERLRFVDRLC